MPLEVSAGLQTRNILLWKCCYGYSLEEIESNHIHSRSGTYVCARDLPLFTTK